MAAPKYLTEILLPAKSEIDIIRDFAVNAHEALENRTPEIPAEDETFAQDMRNFSGLLQQAIDSAESSKKTKPIRISGPASSFIMKMIYPIKQRGFLAEMTLSYLASHLEAFLKDYVLAILVRNPALLKSSAMLTYEDACAFSTIHELRRELAERQIEVLGRGSIDDAAQYFEKKFSVRFADFEQWASLREGIYRRNLIVHNRAKVNDIYKSKTGYTGKKSKLETDMEYVTNAALVIADFMQFVHDRTGSKFAHKRRGTKPSIH